MTSDFKITATQETGKIPVTVFHIHGNIDTNTYQQLQDAAKEAHQNGMRYLLLDLSDVNFVSSAGFRALHSIYSMLRESSDETVGKGIMDGSYKSSHLKLLNPSPNVQLALKTAGFDMYLESFDNHQKAIASFS
jgi:anti-anti-sigma factor